MKEIIKYAVALVLGGVIVYFSVAHNSNTQEKIAYILPEKVFEDFDGTREFRVKMDSIIKGQKTILDSLYLQITLDSKSNNTAQLAKADQNKRNYQSLVNSYEEINKREQTRFSAGAWKQVNQYIEEYGKKEGYKFILGATGAGNLMFADSTFDITSKVVVYINKKYKDE